MRSDLIAQINTDHLVHNCRALRPLCRPGVKMCAVLKADAYGHGIAVVASAFQAAGMDYAAVATLHEAIELRSAQWRPPILLLGNVLAVTDSRERRERIRAIVKYRLTATITDHETIKILARMDLGSPIDVHIKVDTGMGRLGVMPEEAVDLVKAVRAARSLRIVGIYSHFATADCARRALAARQLAAFREVLNRVGDGLPPGVLRHLANSAATLAMAEAHFDMVRPGLALYGYDATDDLAGRIDLKPALRLVSHLTAVKSLPVGHCVGYGQTFTTTRPTRLGMVPVGYYDGYVRSLSNTAIVGTPVGDAPVIGRVSMDHVAIDLSDLPPVGVGAEVVLIDDRPGRPNSVPAIARSIGTIPHEVLCLLGRRIQRVAIGRSIAAPAASRAAAPARAAGTGGTIVRGMAVDA